MRQLLTSWLTWICIVCKDLNIAFCAEIVKMILQLYHNWICVPYYDNWSLICFINNLKLSVVFEYVFRSADVTNIFLSANIEVSRNEFITMSVYKGYTCIKKLTLLFVHHATVPFTWTITYPSQTDVRGFEQRYLLYSAMVNAVTSSIIPITPTIASVVTISVYTATGNTLTASVVNTTFHLNSFISGNNVIFCLLLLFNEDVYFRIWKTYRLQRTVDVPLVLLQSMLFQSLLHSQKKSHRMCMR